MEYFYEKKEKELNNFKNILFENKKIINYLLLNNAIMYDLLIKIKNSNSLYENIRQEAFLDILD